MNSMGLFVCFAVIAVVLAGVDHSQHTAGGKAGDGVHWTTGANTKGFVALNHSTHASSTTLTTTTTVGPTTAAGAAANPSVVGASVPAATGAIAAAANTTVAGAAATGLATNETAPVTTTEAGVTTPAAKKLV